MKFCPPVVKPGFYFPVLLFNYQVTLKSENAAAFTFLNNSVSV